MRLSGRLECHRTEGPARITLVGRGEAGGPAYLTLIGPVPPDVPARLEAASVEGLDGDRYRISGGGRTWTLSARRYLHEDVAAGFYAAVPPRRPPFGRRLFWRVVLAVAASRAGRWWLMRSRP
ncbi:MAG: hypothetical protein ACRETB_03545 [Steroidobacteraceae bacterium]